MPRGHLADWNPEKYQPCRVNGPFWGKKEPKNNGN